MHMKPIALAAAILIASIPYGYSAENDAKAARIMASAWMCSSYAEMKGDAEEHRRLFELGYAKGKQYIDATVAGTITDDERSDYVPRFLNLLSSGPTQEFVLGRIFGVLAIRAKENVVAKDESGIPLPIEDRITDEGIKAAIARHKYAQANCEVLR